MPLKKRKEALMSDNQAKNLEDFIEKYIQNKAKSETAESYRAWLEKKGATPKLDYSENLRKITESYNRSKAVYGTNAERSANLGLANSGYRDYLSQAAKEKFAADKTDTMRKFQSSEQKNRSAYSEYISKIMNSEQKDYQTIIKEISNYGVIDYDTAYRYAVSAGLSGDEAKSAAKNASDLSKNKLRISIMRSVISKSLTAKETKEYALSLGFSEEEANKIAQYAENINDYVDLNFDFIEK